MTENEALEYLKSSKRKSNMLGILPGSDIGNSIIKVLEEVQQYRAIGTAEELQDMKSNYFEALSDWRQYRKIGTLEECRAAVEKQTAKKVKSISQVKDGDSYVGLIGRCPCCGDVLEEDTVYCDCGQRLDWGGRAMRLIDADDVKKMISDTFEKEKDVINSFWKMGTLMEKVDEIQTAYNVDAVVSELDKASCVAQPVGWSAKKEIVELKMAIEIVKGGGVDETN